MALSKAQEKAFRKWLGEHRVNPTCPACGSDSGWTVHNEILSTMVLDLDQKKISPSTNGFLVLVCKNCKHVLFFAAPPILKG
jgi:predicted nucleic-acid-binding Zn-ribbon protein